MIEKENHQTWSPRNPARPNGQQIVAITDNLSTRATQEVQDWLEAHPRWSLQFTPTHASWLNQIEIFFSILHRRLLKHPIFTSETDLAQQMLANIETYNQTAKPVQVDLRRQDPRGMRARISRMNH
jgi:hypothetical protein